MKIRIHDINNNVKSVLSNAEGKQEFSNLEYSFSLNGVGSCSFNVLPQKDYDPTADVSGLEYVYIEDDNGEIIWGGILISFDNSVDSLKFNCLDIKFALSLVMIEENTVFSGNGLDIVSSLLTTAKTKRTLPITISDDSEVLGVADMDFLIGKDIYSCIKDVVEASESRWIINFVKTGNTINAFLVMRSISGVSPQGAGLDRSVSSSETTVNEKISLRFIENSTEKNNISDYRVNYDLRGLVSNPILSTKIAGIPTQFEAGITTYKSYLSAVFGRVEKHISNLEVNDSDTAQKLVNKEVSFPPFNPSLSLDQTVQDIINVGDRVSLTINTNLLKIGSPVSDGSIDYTTPLTVRVEEKNVRVLDGYKEISIEVLGGGANALKSSMTEQFSELRKQVTPVVKESTQGHVHVEANIVDLDKYTKAEADAKFVQI